MNGREMGKVEKTDHSADYTLRTTQNKQPNLRLRGKETQEACLLHLNDHNCIKNSQSFFHVHPILYQPCFLNGLLNTFILICFKCLPSIDIDIW